MPVIKENTLRIQIPAKELLPILLGEKKNPKQTNKQKGNITYMGFSCSVGNSVEQWWLVCSYVYTLFTYQISAFSLWMSQLRLTCLGCPRILRCSKRKGTMMLSTVWTYSLGIAHVSLQHGLTLFFVYSFWWAKTLPPPGTGDARTYWNLPEMCGMLLYKGYKNKKK